MHIGFALHLGGTVHRGGRKVIPFAQQLQKLYGISYFSIGGGIGIVYQDALASGEAAWWEAKAEGERPLTPKLTARRSGRCWRRWD